MKFPFGKTIRRHQLRLGRYLASRGASEYTILVLFSVILGMVAGLAAVGFHKTIELLSGFFWSGHHVWYLTIAIPAFGMFLQWLMTQRAKKQSKQKGVLEIIKAVSMRNGDIPLKTTLFHFLAPVICIATGGTVGPEAPAAQSGAGAVSAVSKLFGLFESRRRIFTAAGAGAAIAGVFNTPLAGVFFSVEVILLNDFHASVLTAFVLSSVSASAVSRIFLGNEPRFHFGMLHLGPYSYLIFYLVLGIGAGLLSIAFIRANEFSKSSFKKLYRRIHPLWAMLIVGLLMGAAGLFFPGILGIGYSSINAILGRSISPGAALLLFILKFVLVILILSSGGYGGIFAPSIFMGACYGYIFSVVFSTVFHITLDPTTFTLVGMGAVLAGINSVPVTAIMILFEMTDNYQFILPLMLGVIGSHVISHFALNGSIYQRELEHAGYRYSAGKEVHVLRSILVEQAARLGIATIAENAPLSEVVRRFLEESNDTIYTVDENNRITGVITSSAFRHLISDYENLRTMLIAQDISDPNVIVIDAEDNLEKAMRLFARHRVEQIPVIYHRKMNQILGTLHYQDVLNVYNHNVTKLSVKDGLAGDLKTLEKNQIAEVMPGISIAEVTVPQKFVGKTIAKLKLRNRFKIDVLMVDRNAGPFQSEEAEPERIMPDINFVLKKGDKLTVYGRTLDVIRFMEFSTRQ